MSYYITTATRKIHAMNKRIRAVPGGSSAGKTISIEQVLIDLAQRDKTPTVTSIVSESLPHLKRGAERDFLNILKNQDYYDDNRWVNHIYKFETGSILEFFGVDELEKVRGPRRDRLFINEANRIPFETFEQLEIRTKGFVFLDWNPSEEFWYYTDVKDKRDDVEEITLTYKDNEGLSPEIVKSLEQRMHRKEWWKVYGLGQLGEVEGKIYKGWNIIDGVPHEAKLVRYWVDFGYSQDPTSIGAIYSYNGGYILDEIAYQTGMSNKMIADVLIAEIENRGTALVVADSSEPKSIDEISLAGVTIVGAVKGPDSVGYGIRVLQDQRISVTKQSVNTIKEYRNYLWEVDRNGKILNVPEGGNDHSMDGIRYAITSLEGSAKRSTGIRQYRPRL
jgi:phage terminase large subunit